MRAVIAVLLSAPTACLSAFLSGGGHGPRCATCRSATLLVSSSVRHGMVGMGISDRTANDGMLYDGWGAEGMRVLNKTSSLQQHASDFGISHYDAVLIVAARAKENAYQTAEEQPGYIGNSFDGNMGSGMHKPLPAKSQVVNAIEELLVEVDENGRLPDLITPGIPDELLERMAAEAAEEAAEAEAAAAEAAGAAEKVATQGRVSDEGDDSLLLEVDEDDEEELRLLSDLMGAPEGAPSDTAVDGDAEGSEESETEDDDDETGDADELFASLLGDAGGADESDANEGDDFDDLDVEEDDLADLFSDLSLGSDDGSIEAGGMSPGDTG